MIYLNPRQGRSSVIHSNMIIPLRNIWGTYGSGMCNGPLRHICSYIHNIKHALQHIHPRTYCTVHTKYMVTYTIYDLNTEQNFTNKLSQVLGFWTGADLPLIRYKLSSYREKAFNRRIINFKSLRPITPGTVCTKDKPSKVKREGPMA